MIGLQIAGRGVVTAVGHNLEQTYTSVVAGITRFRLSKMLGLHGERLVTASVMPVCKEMVGARRGLALASPAIKECISEARSLSGTTALIVCGPERPNVTALPELLQRQWLATLEAWKPLLTDIAAELHQCFGLAISPGLRFEVAEGRASGARAFELAARLIESGKATQILIGGVDSYCDPARLYWNSVAGLSKSRSAPTGFVPGEAAAFLLLRGKIEHPKGVLRGFSSVPEPSVVSGEPCVGEGLTSAVRNVLPDEARFRVGCIWSDRNGERELAKEWQMVAVRSFPHGVAELQHPADCYGDVGAATMPLLVTLSSKRLESAPGQADLIIASSLNLRAAAFLESSSEA